MRVPVRVTDEELERIGNVNPGWRVELVRGVVVMSPPTNWDTGQRNVELIVLLSAWGKKHGYRVFDSSTGFRVTEKDVLSPDCALVLEERWKAIRATKQRGFGPVPDVVELISSPDEAAADQRKCERWFTLGVSHVVALNPTGRKRIATWGTPPSDFPTDWSAVID